MADIKKIKLGNTEYDISALHILDGEGVAKSWSDITSLVENKISIVVLDELPAANASSYATYKSNIVLVPNGGTGQNTKDEYVIQRAGEDPSYTYSWEKIGSTDVDLSGYALKTDAAAKGEYTTSTPSTNATGAAGAATLTTSSDGAQTATGSAEFEYVKAANATGSANGEKDADTGTAGAINYNPEFTGTTATLGLEGSYQPEGSIGGSQSVAAHSHDVNVAAITAGIQEEVVKALPNFDGGSKAADVFTPNGDDTFTPNGDDTFTPAALNSGFYSAGSAASLAYTPVSDVMYSPTVDANGVLSWSAATLDHITGWTANTPAAIDTTKFSGGSFSQGAKASFSQGSKASFSEGTFTPASLGTITKASVLKDIPAITLAGAGAVTISGSNFTFTGNTATISVSGEYQPAGSINGLTVAAHSHSYKAPDAHTHSISLATETITATVSVAVSAHTHTVEIASHTHDMGNHTHGVDIPAIADA